MSPRITVPRFLSTVLALVSFAGLAGCSSGPEAPAPEGDRDAVTAKIGRESATHVVITISASNRVRLDGSRCTPDELPGLLKEKGVAQPRRPVLLVLQDGVKPDAEIFVRKHAAAAGLGPIEVVLAR